MAGATTDVVVMIEANAAADDNRRIESDTAAVVTCVYTRATAAFFSGIQSTENAALAAARMASTSSSVCAVLRKNASKADGAR